MLDAKRTPFGAAVDATLYADGVGWLVATTASASDATPVLFEGVPPATTYALLGARAASVSLAASDIGADVSVTLRSGAVHKGTLVRDSSTAIWLSNATTYRMQVMTRDISTLVIDRSVRGLLVGARSQAASSVSVGVATSALSHTLGYTLELGGGAEAARGPETASPAAASAPVLVPYTDVSNGGDEMIALKSLVISEAPFSRQVERARGGGERMYAPKAYALAPSAQSDDDAGAGSAGAIGQWTAVVAPSGDGAAADPLVNGETARFSFSSMRLADSKGIVNVYDANRDASNVMRLVEFTAGAAPLFAGRVLVTSAKRFEGAADMPRGAPRQAICLVLGPNPDYRATRVEKTLPTIVKDGEREERTRTTVTIVWRGAGAPRPVEVRQRLPLGALHVIEDASPKPQPNPKPEPPRAGEARSTHQVYVFVPTFSTTAAAGAVATVEYTILRRSAAE